MAPTERDDFDRRITPLMTQLHQIAAKLVGAANAPDCVSECLLVAWTQINTFTGSDPPQLLLWLQSILRHECNKMARHQASRRETLLPPQDLFDLFDLADSADTPNWTAEQWHRQRAEIARLLHTANLTPNQRTIVTRWIAGESFRHIGATSEPPRSAAAICHTIKRVRERLKSELAAEDESTHDQIQKCIANLPAALSYEGQKARWARIRAQANQAAAR